MCGARRTGAGSWWPPGLARERLSVARLRHTLTGYSGLVKIIFGWILRDPFGVKLFAARPGRVVNLIREPLQEPAGLEAFLRVRLEGLPDIVLRSEFGLLRPRDHVL